MQVFTASKQLEPNISNMSKYQTCSMSLLEPQNNEADVDMHF